MEYSAYSNYLTEHKAKKTVLKVFLANGTMLKGKIIDFDDGCFILDKCLVNYDQLISMVPEC